jgi:adenylate cyclase
VVSFVDVLRGRLDPAQFRGKLVMIGASGAAGLADEFWTPVSRGGQRMAGVEIHANVAATLLSTQFLRTSPLWLQIGLSIVLALAIAFVAVSLGVAWASLSTAVVLGAVAAASVWVLYAFGIEVPLVTPLLAGIVAFGTVVAWRVSVEQRRARALLRALAAVVPPSVAQQIARAPERVRLGGERRTISVLFTDLRGFTAFSETVSPEVLSGVMSEYLAAMTVVVFEHGGTLDKFIGDAVMAFWNAPLDDPHHAQHACETALAMQARLEVLNVGWAARGLPAQRMRLGLHTGPASVGNLGTPRRFAYTALGDTVNLAARLEPLNNEYGTDACVSLATLDAAGSAFLIRFLDRVTVIGRSMPVEVYELLGQAGDAPLAARWAPLLTPYHRGVQLYQAREFAAAADAFAAALDIAPADAPSAMYLERCTQLIATPPSATWDGALIMRHK